MRADSTPFRLSLAAALALASCAGQGWEQVRAQDNLASYRRFLAENPRSPHAAEAQERVAALQVERDPTLEALARFRHDFPNSTATPELVRQVENRAFEATRAEATADAFDRFVAAFPDGDLAGRARADSEYLRAGGFAGDPTSLSNFIAQHPTSDYAQEAQRSLASVDARANQRVGAVGLRIEIAPGIGDSERLRNVFRDRAHEIYAASGVPLVDGDADTVLTIHHDERDATARDQDGRLEKPGVVAETSVSLQRRSDSDPIWNEQFSWRTPDVDRRGGSALFSASASGYWEHFFVPVATWPTQSVRRTAWTAGGGLAGVEADVGRAIALAPDGSFRELDLSDPAAPRVTAQYKRPAGVARFGGVERIGDRVALFGEDGLEVVSRQGGVYKLAFAIDRGTAGAVASVEEVDGNLLVAGTRGLLRVAGNGGAVERVFERPLRGMARSGDRLFVVDDQWLYLGSARDPRPTGFSTEADFGRGGLEPRGVRADGSVAVVFGDRGVACYELTGGGALRTLAHLRTAVVGSVADAALVGGSVFLIGERGLQVVDPFSGRIVDAVDVKGRGALDAAGGHVVAIGGDRLEVVDVSPWITRTAAAAPAR